MIQEELLENLRKVQKKVRQAAIHSGRSEKDVTLIAVSKTKPLPMLEVLYQAGVREFGENKVQELSDKFHSLGDDIKWHMIGHLQRNKVKQLVGKAHLIHSVDSIRLASQIEEEAAKQDKVISILIEVNVAQEESKYGVAPEDTESLIREIAVLPHIRVCGLMTVAPFVEDAENNRIVFQKMRQLCLDIQEQNIDNVNMDILSMGMTNDYEVAIEEGATMVRIGTAIFGEREYINH